MKTIRVPQCYLIYYIKSNATFLNNHNLWDNVSTRPYLLLLQGYTSGNYPKLFLPENEKMIGKLFLHRPCTILRQNIVLLFALLFFYFFCNMRFQVPHICHTDLAITKIVIVC